MYSFPRIVASRLLLAGLCVPLILSAASRAQISVRAVKVLDSKDTVEIEVEASDRVVPQTRVLTGPDRLVIDFPNSTPGAQMRNQSVNRGEVKDVRFALFQSKPPVTRIVVDLKTAQSYQVFPYGRTTIIKVTGAPPDSSAGDDPPTPAQSRPGLVAANYTTGAEPVQVAPPVKPLDVTFRDGLLSIKANKATLSEVLFAVQQQTGAIVASAPGADQERVVVDLGPGPAPEVLAQLLHGSRFNFLILSSEKDARQLDRVILSPRTDGGAMPLAPIQSASAEDDAQSAPVQPQPSNPPPVAGRPQPDGAPPPPEENPPDQ
jgi:hypothetical protein